MNTMQTETEWSQRGAFEGNPQTRVCSAADLKAISDELDAYMDWFKAQDAAREAR